MAVGSNTLGLMFKISADIGSTQTQLKAVTDQLKVGADAAKASISDLGSQFKILSGFLEGLVAGGLTGFIEGVIKSATATADWVNELDRASQATSIEIRTLAQLEGAFKEAGGSLNSMISTFDIFASKLEQAREGNNKLIDILEKYGITSKDVTQATDEAFKALGAMTDQTEKARVAQELFGKGGARQILQFKDLKDGIKGVTEEYKGLGDAIDPKLIEAARAYEAESKKLDAALVANRAVIAGILLPAWVEFNASIRRAMESLTSFQKLSEHANEALDKFKIGPGLPKAPERGLEGEVVTEAEARAATEAGIAARSLEAARKVKDEKIKIAKQQAAGISDADKELERAQKELDAERKQRADAFIKTLEDNLKELNAAILAASDPAALAKWKLQILDFGDFMNKEIGEIVKDLAKLAQPVPAGGGGGPIPGAPAAIPLPVPPQAIKDLGSLLDDLHRQMVQNIDDAIKLGGAWGGMTQTLKEMFSLQNIADQFVLTMKSMLDTFIQTGHTGPAVLRQLVAGVFRSIAEMSAEWGTFFLLMAIGFAALGDWADAAKFAAAGAGLMVLAAALGFAASKIGPSQTTNAAAAGGGFGGASSQAPGTVTVNQGATSALGIQLQQLNALNNISNTLSTASPGDVVTRGAEQNPVAIGQANNEAARRDGSVSREFLQISGLRTA
jgi:hypothetical protein